MEVLVLSRSNSNEKPAEGRQEASLSLKRNENSTRNTVSAESREPSGYDSQHFEHIGDDFIMEAPKSLMTSRCYSHASTLNSAGSETFDDLGKPGARRSQAQKGPAKKSAPTVLFVKAEDEEGQRLFERQVSNVKFHWRGTKVNCPSIF